MSTTLDTFHEFWWIFTNRLNKLWVSVAFHLLTPLLSLWVQILEHPFTGTPNISLISCWEDTIILISVHLFQRNPLRVGCFQLRIVCDVSSKVISLRTYLWQWSKITLRHRDFKHTPTLLAEKEYSGWKINNIWTKCLFHCATLGYLGYKSVQKLSYIQICKIHFPLQKSPKKAPLFTALESALLVYQMHIIFPPYSNDLLLNYKLMWKDQYRLAVNNSLSWCSCIWFRETPVNFW